MIPTLENFVGVEGHPVLAFRVVLIRKSFNRTHEFKSFFDSLILRQLNAFIRFVDFARFKANFNDCLCARFLMDLL